MPNWVTHKLNLTGTPRVLREFTQRHLKSLNAQTSEESTASDLALVPRSLPPIESKGQSLLGHIWQRFRGSTQKQPEAELPSPVFAVFPDGTIKEEVRIPTGPVLDFETLLPLGDKDASDVWGTKWNASMGRIAGDPETGSVTIWFDTPWSIPEPIFDAIADKYPQIKADGHAFDELWNFAAKISIEDGSADVEQVDATVALYREVYGNEPDTIPDHVGEVDDDTVPGPLTDTVKDCLDENDWTFDLKVDENSNASQFSANVQVASQNYGVFIDVDEDDEQVAVFFYAPFNVPIDRICEMVVLLNWINHTTRVGRLVVPTSNEPAPIQWKAVLDVEGSELSAKQVETLISAGANTFETYANAMSLVALTKTTVEAAIERWDNDRRTGLQ